MDGGLKVLSSEGLGQFEQLKNAAMTALVGRFHATYPQFYQRSDSPGSAACRQDLEFHLEFLRPVLEFGVLQPMVDYLCWLADVLAVRSIRNEHLALSLDWLGEFFADNINAADAQIISDALRAARESFMTVGKPSGSPPAPAAWPETAGFVAALLAGRQREALAIVTDSMDRGHSLTEIELHVIQPALYRIGEQWQASQVSVAQEHLATAIAHSVMSMALLRAPAPPSIRRRVLLACVEGNHHAVGLQMVADAYQLAGWDIQYLGGNVPTTALLQQIACWQPDLLGLSVSFPQQLPAVRTIIQRLHEDFGDQRPPVMLGGLAINRFGQLASMMGADAFAADAGEALLRTRQITSGIRLRINDELA